MTTQLTDDELEMCFVVKGPGPIPMGMGLFRSIADRIIAVVRAHDAAKQAEQHGAELAERLRVQNNRWDDAAKQAAPEQVAPAQDDEALLPCPFCDTPAPNYFAVDSYHPKHGLEVDRYKYIMCANEECPALIESIDMKGNWTKEQMFSAWNTRATDRAKQAAQPVASADDL